MYKLIFLINFCYEKIFFSFNFFFVFYDKFICRIQTWTCQLHFKKKDNCGAYLYNTKTGSTYFCNSTECKEIQEAIEEVASEEGSTDTKKSKIPKKKKKKKSKIPKFKKTN